MSKKIECRCENCGAIFYRYRYQIREHTFCCRECARGYLSEKMTRMNRELNPTRMRDETRRKISATRKERGLGFSKPYTGGAKPGHKVSEETRRKLSTAFCGAGDPNPNSYEKTLGRHTHRIVAEQKLGRPLRKGEVVHHIDGNKRNNAPENLMVFKSQAEHARWHKLNDRR